MVPASGSGEEKKEEVKRLPGGKVKKKVTHKIRIRVKDRHSKVIDRDRINRYNRFR